MVSTFIHKPSTFLSFYSALISPEQGVGDGVEGEKVKKLGELEGKSGGERETEIR